MERIPWTKPDYWGDEIANVNEALESTWISGGKFVDELENQFKELLGKKHAISVSNGTSAIHLAYLGLGLKAGDEVIIPGFCFLAAANIAIQMGIKPVFCEVDTHSFCINVDDLKSRITSNTKAIMAVHTYGNVCDMDSLISISNEYDIPVIEDCAESLFSKYNGKQCGSIGEVSTFSFQATKTITTGEGGMVATDNDEIANIMKLYRSHGMDRSKIIYWHELPGHNFRLSNLQAAMGVAQMKKFSTIIKKRKEVYYNYLSLLNEFEGISFQKIENNVNPLIWAIAIKLEKKIIERDELIKKLYGFGIETRPGFYSSDQLEIYEKHSLPTCREISENVISLPSYPTLHNDQIIFICEKLKEILCK